MAAFGVVGTRMYVGDTALVDIEDAADALADFTALTTQVEVGSIENIGNFGKMFQEVSFQNIKDGRTYKFKGGFDEGTLEMTVAADLSDAGLLLLRSYAEAADQNTYPFKITFTGAPTAYDTMYFGGKVFSFQFQTGTVNNVVKALIRIGINTPIFFQ